VGARKKPNNEWRAVKPAQRRLAKTAKKKKKKNPKNTETDKKVIHQNTKTNTEMEGRGKETGGIRSRDIK
jgi:hypothetical protein